MDRILAPRPVGAMAMRIAKIVAPSLFASLLLSSGCSTTAPSGDDDAVHRCATKEDCPKSPDNRFEFACVRASNQGEQSEQVCEPRKRPVQCNFVAGKADVSPTPTGGKEYLAYLAGNAQALSKASKELCPEDKAGTLGCAPKEGKCDEGEPTKIGSVEFCSDPANPTVPATDSPLLLDTDVRDQFCRWYFCDEQVVCHNSFCQPCDPSKKFEDGGCRTVYRNGEISSAYADVAGNCNTDGGLTEADIQAADKVFGDFPPAAGN